MSHPSPPAARVVAVLDFLGGHPDQAFTLSEISKALRISSATCHALLATLAEASYVYRTVGKTYVLGPALGRIAQASLAPGLVMQVARPEMRLLADEFDVVCTALRLDGEEVVAIERASALSHINWNALQHSLPIAAPVGFMFRAWPAEVYRRWIETAEPPLDAKDRELLDGAVGFLRDRGYSFGAKLPAGEGVVPAGQNYSPQSSVEPARMYLPAYVSAPIFSSPGDIAFALSLGGFATPVRGSQIEEMGARLRAACDRIGAFMAGREQG